LNLLKVHILHKLSHAIFYCIEEELQEQKKKTAPMAHTSTTASVHENQQKATEKKKALTRVEEAQFCT
jgi:hypothetical protein